MEAKWIYEPKNTTAISNDKFRKHSMDKLDIFEMDSDTKIQTTIAEVQRAFMIGAREGMEFNDDPVIIIGDVV